MTIVLYLVVYVTAAVFLLACIARIVMYARAPLHLRWELYPVPHEKPGRVKHGGSRFEEVDWWTRPDRFGFLGELKFMVPEMLFLKGLYEFNRKLWYRSFPFHFGLYLLIGTLGLLVSGALFSLFAPTAFPAALAHALQLVSTATGAAGLVLAMLGAAALLVRRVTDPSLKLYTTRGDIGNLIFFLAAFGVLAAGSLLGPSPAPDMLAIALGLLTWNTALQIPGLLAAGLLLTSLLVAYIPLTHMSHFIAKYFTYHAVRWDDVPNRRGGKLEARLAEYLTYRPTWAAAHIGADGRKTWAQIATDNPTPEGKK
jgi:nitrate reductase gamma subunit